MSWQKRFLMDYGNDYDRGHFMAQSIGGDLDINIFPQKRSFNQRGSAQGNEYRGMGTLAKRNPNSFCFSRPFYSVGTWVPYSIDYGVIASPDFSQLRCRTFPNL